MFDPFMNLSRFLWYWRWWLVVISSLLLFLIMNSAEITNDSDITNEASQQVRFNFAMVFACLAAQLVAWLIGVLHAAVMRRFKWLVSILVMPPVAFIYLYLKN
jgi:hypothetical protein